MQALEAYSLRSSRGERLLAFRGLVGLSGEGAASRTTWIQIAPLGEWHGHGEGPFELTENSFASCIAAFKAQVNPPQVDYEHASLSPMGGPVPAAGWVQDLAVRDGWLCALVEFTERAADHIRAGEYRFNSGVFAFDRPDRKTGESIACVLDSIALTNRPFIDGQTPIALTYLPAARALSHGERKMEISREALMAGLEALEGDTFSEQQLHDLIASVVAMEAAKNPSEAEPEIEVEEPMTDAAAAALSAPPASPLPVAPLAEEPAPAADAGAMIAEKLKSATGLDDAGLLAAIEANMDAIVAALKGSGEAPLPMSSTPTTPEVAVLTDTVKALSAKLAKYDAQEKAARKAAIDREVDELVVEGKVLPSSKDAWRGFAHANYEHFKKLSAVIPVVVPTGREAIGIAPPVPSADGLDVTDPRVRALTEAMDRAGVKSPEIREKRIREALERSRPVRSIAG